MKAVYAGSFDPFTVGHYQIAKEAVELFDHLFIVIAFNDQKKRRTCSVKMSKILHELFEADKRISVLINYGLTADFCKDFKAEYLVRGLRNTSDYMYEENIAKINQEINPDLKTIYLRASNDAISSSMVWELRKNKKPIQKYLPYDESLMREEYDAVDILVPERH